MKPWIKLETSLLSDPRINHLMDDMGLGGLGLYILIRMNIECMGEGALTQDQVWAVCKKYTRISKMMRIFYDYDLFDIREDLLVRMPAHVPTHEPAPMPAREPGYMPEPMPGCIPEHVPIGIEIEQNIEIEGDVEKPTTSTMDSIQKIREWLLDDRNLIWREPMMMHSGYGSLLQLHWPEAVEFFIQHMLSQDKLDRMINEHEAKRYFANFSKIGLGSGKALMEHLINLNDNQSRIAYQESQIDSGRPPKPSPTAVWSYATDSWTEVH